MAAGRPRWSGTATWPLAAAGGLTIVLHATISTLAVTGLGRIQDAHDAVERIDIAQRHFQDADMAHDAVLAGAGALTLDWAGVRPGPRSRGKLEHDIADFRAELDAVDAVDLPRVLEARVIEVRPLQDRYLTAAEQLLAVREGGQAVRAYNQVAVLAADLVQRQDDVTQALDDEGERLRTVAGTDERRVRQRLLVSALLALSALVGLTLLLTRLGRRLTGLVTRERGVAETLQQRLLPDRLPDLPGVRLAARYTPGAVGSDVGGDWYDVVPLPGGRVGLVMGDVVGHDVRAAASMGQLRNALRAIAADGTSPAEVLNRLNRLSVTQRLGDMASVVYAVLDPVEGVIEVANAGHPPPLLVDGHGVRLLEGEPNPPVGVVREARFASTRWEVPAGSRLLLYTDGLVERRGTALEPHLRRLQRLLETGRATGLERLCDDLLTGMVGGLPTDDDVALLLVAPQTALGQRVEVTFPAEAERLTVLRHLLERWLAEVGAEDDEAYDVLVASSEAATNAVEHAYGPAHAEFRVVCEAHDGGVTVVVRDWGTWREPRGRDRGRGRWLMEGLMDEVQVLHSTAGTEVRLHRRLRHPRTSSEVGRTPVLS